MFENERKKKHVHLRVDTEVDPRVGGGRGMGNAIYGLGNL